MKAQRIIFLGKILNYRDGKDYIIGKMIIKDRKGEADAALMKYPFVLNMTKCFNGIWTDIVEPNEEIRKILFHNIDNITKAALLHKKSIKRFVNEYFNEGHEAVIINPSSSDKKSIFNLYILYIIGKSEIEVIDDNSLQKIAKKALGLNAENEFAIDDEVLKALRDEILSNENYSDILERGANIIKDWK